MDTTEPKLPQRKADHLRFKSDFDYVRIHGAKSVGRAVVAVIAPSRSGIVRCGVVCGKKYSLKAVARNRARRLLWESYRHLKSGLAAAEIILIPRYRLAELKEPEVRQELSRLLSAAGIYSPAGPDGAGCETGPDVVPSE